jgi:phospholipid/cholesterol/gamma-HCH transport system substrate-binding protein
MKVRKEVKAGLLVVVALALFIFGFNFLKGRNIFHKQRTFHAVYSRIDGLASSNPIVLNGLGIGQVTGIKLLPGKDGDILVTFSVNVGHLDIPINSTAKIVSQDLLGSKAVELLLGDSDMLAVEGDTLRSDIQASLTEEVSQQVAPIRAKAEHLLSSIDSVMTVVQALMTKELTANLERSVQSISKTIQSLEKTAYRIDTVVIEEHSRINAIMRNVESITANFRNNNERLNSIITNFQNISDTIAKANIASTLQHANHALLQTSNIMDRINRGEGSIGMLINNDTLYHNLERASLDLDRLLQDIRVNPHRYLHFSLIGRRNRNLPLDK